MNKKTCSICGLSYEPEPVSDVCFEDLCPLCRFSIVPLFEKDDDPEKYFRYSPQNFYRNSLQDKKDIERIKGKEELDDGWGAGR